MSAVAVESLYQQVVSRIPGRQEATVTKLEHLREQDLRVLHACEPRVIKGRVRQFAQAMPGQCHAVAAYAWLRNPGWRLAMGFAYSEELNEACSSWHFHSFCVDEKGRIIEPTTIDRDAYWGVILDEKHAHAFAWEEVENMKALNYELTPKMWKVLVGK